MRDHEESLAIGRELSIVETDSFWNGARCTGVEKVREVNLWRSFRQATM